MRESLHADKDCHALGLDLVVTDLSKGIPTYVLQKGLLQPGSHHAAAELGTNKGGSLIACGLAWNNFSDQCWKQVVGLNECLVSSNRALLKHNQPMVHFDLNIF